MMIKPICFVLLFFGPALAVKDYTGYQVLRVTSHTKGQYLRLAKLCHELEDKVDIWKEPRGVDHPVDIMVSPDLLDAVKNALTSLRLETSIFVQDVQKGINEERCADCPKKSDEFDYTVYHTYEQISTWVTDFADKPSSLTITEENIGSSFDNRQIKAIKISSGNNKRIAYMQGGAHAREWISTATLIYIANQMVTLYDTDYQMKQMIDNYDWYIVPLLNVDGYVNTWTDDRMWRKNMQTNDDSVCVGTDLNRNYPYEWGGTGASPSPCSETYRGKSALSSPEVKVLDDWLKQFSDRIALFIDFQNYGQFWLYPWGYTAKRNTYQPDKDAQHNLAVRATSALKMKYQTDYFVGMTGSDLYPASGVSEDYGYGTLKVKYSYRVILRDEGRFGFLMPEVLIEESGEETLDALKVIGADPLN